MFGRRRRRLYFMPVKKKGFYRMAYKIGDKSTQKRRKRSPTKRTPELERENGGTAANETCWDVYLYMWVFECEKMSSPRMQDSNDDATGDDKNKYERSPSVSAEHIRDNHKK